MNQPNINSVSYRVVVSQLKSVQEPYPLYVTLQIEGRSSAADGYTVAGYFYEAVASDSYDVTYFLDPNGEYTVENLRLYKEVPSSLTPFVCSYKRKYLAVCFLPREWEGKTVSRRVGRISG